MGSVMIGDFGVKKGVQTFRICGSKEDLYKIIEECWKMEAKFYDTPNILHVHRGQWTMLLQIIVSVPNKCEK